MTKTFTIHFLPLLISVFLTMFTILAYFCYTLSVQLEALNLALNSLQFNYTNLTMEISRLQGENLLLKEELSLIKKSNLDLSPLNIVSEISNKTTSDEYNIFIIKVIIFVVGILLISILIYVLSTGLYTWVAQSFIGKLVGVTNALGLKAAGFMGLANQKVLHFSDSLGNRYDVFLKDNNMIDVQIQAVGEDTWQSIASFLSHQDREIHYLTQQLASFREILQTTLANQSHAESAFAHINEVISTPTIGIESTINLLTSVPSNDVNALLDNLMRVM